LHRVYGDLCADICASKVKNLPVFGKVNNVREDALEGKNKDVNQRKGKTKVSRRARTSHRVPIRATAEATCHRWWCADEVEAYLTPFARLAQKKRNFQPPKVENYKTTESDLTTVVLYRGDGGVKDKKTLLERKQQNV